MSMTIQSLGLNQKGHSASDISIFTAREGGGGEPPEPDVLDITGFTYASKSLYVGGYATVPTSMFMKPDGTAVFVTGQTSDKLHKFTLSTPGDISTGSFDSSTSAVLAGVSKDFDFFFKPDGTKCWCLDRGPDDVTEFSFSTPWDLSTIDGGSTPFSIQAQEGTPSGLWFKLDGTKFYVIGAASDDLIRYNLSTPWDITTASDDSNQSTDSTASEQSTPRGICMSAEGDVMLLAGVNQGYIFQYDLSTSWDAETLSYSSVSVDYSGETGAAVDVHMSADYTKMYVLDNANDTIYQYEDLT